MIRWIRIGGLLMLFALVLGTDCVRLAPIRLAWLRQCRDEVVSSLVSEEVQKLAFLCLGAYLVGFLVRLRSLRKNWRLAAAHSRLVSNVEILRTGSLLLFCGVAVLQYFLGPPNVSGSTDAVVLLLGVVLGQAVVLLKTSQRNSREGMEAQEDVVNVLIILLSLSVLLQPGWWQGFQYRGEKRWQGIWWNPNNFGLLMAAGIALASGQGLRTWLRRGDDPTQRPFVGRYGSVAAYAVAAGLMTIGLVKSYSRGAWLAVITAMLYLASRVFRCYDGQTQTLRAPTETGRTAPTNRKPSLWFLSLLRNRLVMTVIVVSVTAVAFWAFRDTQWSVARRAFSVGNINDFSWRNRMVAYGGALQMMATKPWFGFGWDQPKGIYDQFYKPTKLDEGKAIELNDYFMVGMTLGLPALIFFVGYVWLALMKTTEYGSTKQPLVSRGSERIIKEWGNISCRGGVIVLLVGFWLERGLFWIALAVPFWILLELARSDDGEYEL